LPVTRSEGGAEVGAEGTALLELTLVTVETPGDILGGEEVEGGGGPGFVFGVLAGLIVPGLDVLEFMCVGVTGLVMWLAEAGLDVVGLVVGLVVGVGGV
jgi:hypothetical protein